MHAAAYCQIPLRNRSGQVLAWTLVDPEHFEALNAFKWHWSQRRYVGRSVHDHDGGRRATVYMHRQIMGLDLGDFADAPRDESGARLEVDHVNRDRLDNRMTNLRIVTPAQNSQNLSARGRFRGVELHRQSGKWRAVVEIGGKRHSLGYHATEAEAGAVAAAFRAQHMSHATD